MKNTEEYKQVMSLLKSGKIHMTELKLILNWILSDSYMTSTEKGVAIATACEWDVEAIYRVMRVALTDANAHSYVQQFDIVWYE